MMKRYILFIIFSFAILPAIGQGVMDYYQLPEKSQQYKRLVNRYGGPQIKDRWYVSVDGFVKTDRAQLDNSHDGLIESNLVGKAGWGVSLGWTFRERWAIEGSYARMPLHTQFAVAHTSPPLSMRTTDMRDAFMLRGKRLVLSTSKPWLRSGFWVSGGVWAMPGMSKLENASAAGYRYQNRWEAGDVFKLTTQTQTTGQVATLAELGVEYNVRLCSALDFGVSARKLWGFTNAVTTDVTYVGNRPAPQQAQLLGKGAGMNYGVTLRYSFSTRRTPANVLNVQGKSRLSQ